jgi:hypothetical protein
MEEVEAYVHSSLTSALDGVSGQPHVTTALPSGKDPRVLLNRGLRGLQNRYGRFY